MKETDVTLEEFISGLANYLKDAPDWEVLNIWNSFCFEAGNESEICLMGEIDELFSSPLQALRMVDKSFNANDEYFYFTVFGIESTDCPLDVVDVEDMGEWYYENPDALEDALSATSIGNLMNLARRHKEDEE